jgi:hypothetical protein
MKMDTYQGQEIRVVIEKTLGTIFWGRFFGAVVDSTEFHAAGSDGDICSGRLS